MKCSWGLHPALFWQSCSDEEQRLSGVGQYQIKCVWIWEERQIYHHMIWNCVPNLFLLVWKDPCLYYQLQVLDVFLKLAAISDETVGDRWPTDCPGYKSSIKVLWPWAKKAVLHATVNKQIKFLAHQASCHHCKTCFCCWRKKIYQSWRCSLGEAFFY